MEYWWKLTSRDCSSRKSVKKHSICIIKKTEEKNCIKKIIKFRFQIRMEKTKKKSRIINERTRSNGDNHTRRSTHALNGFVTFKTLWWKWNTYLNRRIGCVAHEENIYGVCHGGLHYLQKKLGMHYGWDVPGLVPQWTFSWKLFARKTICVTWIKTHIMDSTWDDLEAEGRIFFSILWVLCKITICRS